MYWKNKQQNQLFYTNYYVSDSFMHSHPWQDRKAALKCLQKMSDFLTEKNIVHWMSCGTALVLNRNVQLGEDFLPAPKSVLDIDIFTDEPISAKKAEELFPGRAYNLVGCIAHEKQKNMKNDLMCVSVVDEEDTNMLIHLWIYKRKQDVYLNNNLLGYEHLYIEYHDDQYAYTLHYPAEKLNEITKLEFEEYSLPFLGTPNWYCEFRYGKNWKTPVNVDVEKNFFIGYEVPEDDPRGKGHVILGTSKVTDSSKNNLDESWNTTASDPTHASINYFNLKFLGQLLSDIEKKVLASQEKNGTFHTYASGKKQRQEQKTKIVRLEAAPDRRGPRVFIGKEEINLDD